MKNFIFSILMLLCSLFCRAQSITEIKSDTKKYIWGEGSGTTISRADQEALAMLVNNISVQVESKFSHLTEEVVSAGKGTFNEVFHGVINTYSNSTLKNTERILISNEPDAKVFRYILRSEVDKIFAERKVKIFDFIQNAMQYQEAGEISFALRYYYWALTLLRSHPDANVIKTPDGNQTLISWIPVQINKIFSGIEFKIKDVENEGDFHRYILDVTYNGNQIKYIDYSYWTGRDWSNLYNAKCGVGLAEIFGNEVPNDLKIRIEYAFEGEVNIDNELKDVMSKIEIIPFRSSYINAKMSTLSTSKSDIKPNEKEKFESSIEFNNLDNNIIYKEKIDRIIHAINAKKYESVKDLFNDYGFEQFKRLVQYGNARVVSSENLKYIQFGENVVCRSLKINFGFTNNNRKFIEDVVLNFNKERKICNVSFSLSQTAIADIISKDIWSEKVRMTIIDFLENYKTAYALKRADYIESIFADDAVIIIGSVLKTKPIEANPFKNNQIVKYNRYTKEKFIANLKHSFASNEYINIQFEDNIVKKSGKGGDIYGIQIKQNYYSSSYGDSGYLFILVDINNPDAPIIHVRTWQPQKNEDGSIYGLGDF